MPFFPPISYLIPLQILKPFHCCPLDWSGKPVFQQNPQVCSLMPESTSSFWLSQNWLFRGRTVPAAPCEGRFPLPPPPVRPVAGERDSPALSYHLLTTFHLSFLKLPAQTFSFQAQTPTLLIVAFTYHSQVTSLISWCFCFAPLSLFPVLRS